MLAIRLAMLALLTMLGLAAVVSAAEIAALYVDERRRAVASLEALSASVAPSAARAAYHVDDVQAVAIIVGVMQSPRMRAARITTERGDRIAERRRALDAGFGDGLSRRLFGDVATLDTPLRISAAELAGYPPSAAAAAPEAEAERIEVGVLSLEISPEVVGQRFFNATWVLLGALILELSALAGVLLYVVHRNVTAPLSCIGEAMRGLNLTDARTPTLETTLYTRQDELGLIIERSNEMIARLKEQHEALLHREKVAALGSLLSGVAHELNNPLAIVIAQAELLEETATDEATRQRAERILSPAKRCARIIHTFLAMARNRPMEMAPTDLRDLSEQAIGLLEFSLRRDRVETEIIVETRLEPIEADAAQLSQAILNLLVNAAQALRGRAGTGRIAIRLRQNPSAAGGLAVITVADNGPGIPSELRERALQPFFTTKPDGEGTGLGLSYVSRVAQNHGGLVEIGASDLGGAAVSILVPVSQPKTEATPRTATTETAEPIDA